MAQSPPPERQSGKQLHEVPGSGEGTNEEASKISQEQQKETKKTGLENLTSNPKGVLDDEVTKKFAKNTKMDSESKSDSN
ncbi:hypothetical protein QBC37DRAFT_415115 [Rhypophila decipiens]|uniref:Uncharacterized protein n=1 Tax=Rhypophila decipiens TaxID=261697 RepID=A0AAN6YDC0_9PEZI|nr:hypothetical protein QBC37DRAFT_415115 [Rhypophila decipiens]